jgi:hypothetical protein
MTAPKTCNEENEAKVSSEGEKEATVSNEEEKEEDDANMNPGSPLPNSTSKKRQTATDAIERRRSPQLNKVKTTKKLHDEHGPIPPSSSEERNSIDNRDDCFLCSEGPVQIPSLKIIRSLHCSPNSFDPVDVFFVSHRALT